MPHSWIRLLGHDMMQRGEPLFQAFPANVRGRTEALEGTRDNHATPTCPTDGPWLIALL